MDFIDGIFWGMISMVFMISGVTVVIKMLIEGLTPGLIVFLVVLGGISFLVILHCINLKYNKKYLI